MKNEYLLNRIKADLDFDEDGDAENFALENDIWKIEDKLYVRIPQYIDNPFYKKLSSVLLTLITTKDNIDIVLLVDSYGGELEAATGIYNLLSSMDNNITTITFNNCCSAACILYSLGKKRYFLDTTNYLIHQVRIGLDSANNVQTSSVKKIADSIEKTQNKYKEILAKRTKIPEKVFLKAFSTLDDTHFSIEEVLKYKIATDVVTKFSEIVL